MKLSAGKTFNQEAIEAGHEMNSEIEYVARAFYDAHEDAQLWDHEPEIIKDEFRAFAREAIRILSEQEAGKVLAADAGEFSEAA